MKYARIEFAAAETAGMRIILRANRFFPGKSLIINPDNIVNNPCPGIPGTASSAPKIISIAPTKFFITNSKIRNTMFFMGRTFFVISK